MNGQTAVIRLQRPAFAGWGYFTLAFIPLAVLFPVLVLPLLLSVALVLQSSSMGDASVNPSPRPEGLIPAGHRFRAPPLA